MTPKYNIGDTVEFNGMVGTIIEINDYSDTEFEYDLTPAYRIRVNNNIMSGGYDVFAMCEEALTIHEM